jgi:hypothetical protein
MSDFKNKKKGKNTISLTYVPNKHIISLYIIKHMIIITQVKN